MKKDIAILAARNLAAHKDGSKLTDDELRSTIKTLQPIILFLSAAGMEYDLVWKDLLLASEAMKIILRNRRKGLTGEIG